MVQDQSAFEKTVDEMRFEVIRQNLLKLEADKCSSSERASYERKKSSKGNNVDDFQPTTSMV